MYLKKKIYPLEVLKLKKNEKTLGEIFCFFILETILDWKGFKC